MSSACQPGLLPDLSLDTMKLGLWHRDNNSIKISPANRAQKASLPGFHSGLCFKQTIGWLSWLSLPLASHPMDPLLFLGPAHIQITILACEILLLTKKRKKFLLNENREFH